MCIITRIKINNNIYLAKNRDRPYQPNIGIIHTISNNTEVMFIYDYDTGWAEGINEFGIGVINSTLNNDADTAERALTMPKNKKLIKHDGKKIIKSLQHKTIKGVCNSLMTYDGGLNGHTFVSDNKKSVMKKYALYVGRWQNWHQGHEWLINQQLEQGKNVWVAIRDVEQDINNPKSASQILLELSNEPFFQNNFDKILLSIIPDIESINYGRGVGYDVIYHEPPAEVAIISGTAIRTGHMKPDGTMTYDETKG